MEVGLRVVRGPDWKWGNQDDGEGHVGTVIEIGKPGSTTSPDKTVVVQWDCGSRTNYRVGYQGAYDLRIFDNAPIGIKHSNIICDACKKQGIQGMRWRCLKCHDFDLCIVCYNDDKHDVMHSFLRFDTVHSKGVKVPKRINSLKIPAKGIFTGARVGRGPDWDWGNQDGGDGKFGTVKDIRGWDSESGRSVANVVWSSGQTNVYRVGHKGKVDLKYIKYASGGFYHRDHLPVLGEVVDPLPPSSCLFKVNDKVRVESDVEVLKIMQEGHGGWNQKMAEYIGMVGTVHRITDRGDVRVQYEGCNNRWTFHPGALSIVCEFSVGDVVKISENIHLVKELQKGHGEWTDNMHSTLGKIGCVSKVYPDKDLRVTVEGTTWTLNPNCCTAVTDASQELNTSASGKDQGEPASTAALTTLLEQLFELQAVDSGPDRLVREAAQGHTEVVKELLQKFPDKVNQKSSGKTALQVSSHQGHKEVVLHLLNANANLELQDEDGDTALHYSGFGNQPEVMELLLTKGADINMLNDGGCSTLHVAVNKQLPECVRVLLKFKCNVNIQDAYGDTALHDAMGKENKEIIEMLVGYPGIDFTVRNHRGFNVLHHAALKGNNFATPKILHKSMQIVDLKKDDGFSALHLAALNGHKEVAKSLLAFGANSNTRNNRSQTPLLLAVSQGHTALIELLLSAGADIHAKDEDGDTCLHLALMRQTLASENQHSPMLEIIRSQLGMDDQEEHTGAAIACYLIHKGCSLEQRNNKNKTPLDVINKPHIANLIQQYAVSQKFGNQLAPATEETVKATNECRVCSEQPANVTFQPCGHVVSCAACCIKMKKCIQCRVPIHSKTGPDGSPTTIIDQSAPDPKAELQQKLQEIEDKIICSICMERNRNMVFMCGHATCSKCGEELSTCHMCRKPILKKIPLY